MRASSVRRTAYLYVTCRTARRLDLERILTGSAELDVVEELVALSVLTGEEYPISLDELALVKQIPSDRWIGTDDLDADDETLDRLAQRGLLVSDQDDDELLSELRRRDERLTAEQWHPHAALYHFLTKWRDVGLGLEADVWDESLRSLTGRWEGFVEQHGASPPRFKHVDALEVVDLPLVRGEGPLYEVLARRATTRAFDPETPITTEQLSLLLYEVFGVHGHFRINEDVTVLKKTSPSGGARHSVEVYPVVRNVEGVEPGLYHYNAERHALDLMEPMTPDDAAALATTATSSQGWTGDAAVTFVLTSRFYRSFWKYRQHNKILITLYMDASHLSQTLFLVAAECGLGAFVTAAINAMNIEERLGLDGYEEGALAVLCCGPRLDEPHPLEPDWLPFVPRETKI